jgi:hypothetical protein
MAMPVSRAASHLIREIDFGDVARSKRRQCGNLREDARENVGAQNFVLDMWNYLLAS